MSELVLIVQYIRQFLVDQSDTGLQYCTINTSWSAISTTHSHIEGSTLGSHPLHGILLVIRGMLISQPPVDLPRDSCSCDNKRVVKFLD